MSHDTLSKSEFSSAKHSHYTVCVFGIKSGVAKKNSRAISNILVLVLQIYQNILFGNTTSPAHKMGHLYGFMNPQPPLLCCQGTLLLLPINLGHNLISVLLNIDIIMHLLCIRCNKISKSSKFM